MEYTAGGSAGRGTCARGTDGQADERRISKRSLDPAGQHHDARARRDDDLNRVARARDGRNHAAAPATTESGDVAHTGGSKEAAGAETGTCARAGSDCPGGVSSRRFE
jgi:hypothetical protein